MTVVAIGCEEDDALSGGEVVYAARSFLFRAM